MPTIDPTTQLVAIIRQQVAGARATPTVQRIGAGAEKDSVARHQRTRNLADLVAQRVGTISPDDPQRNRKAFRAFLESVLLGEFGTELINDPAFYHVVDDVQRTMEEDTHLASQIDEAGRLLLAGRPPLAPVP
jgi:hypothetical protein